MAVRTRVRDHIVCYSSLAKRMQKICHKIKYDLLSKEKDFHVINIITSQVQNIRLALLKSGVLFISPYINYFTATFICWEASQRYQNGVTYFMTPIQKIHYFCLSEKIKILDKHNEPRDVFILAILKEAIPYYIECHSLKTHCFYPL